MFAALAGAVLPAIIKGIVASLMGIVAAWVKSQQDQQLGMTVEAAKVDQTTATTAVAMAQAEADAPKTLDGVIGRLNKGTF